MNKYQEDYVEFIESLKYIDELVDSLTIEQRKSLGATTWSIKGVLGRYINEEKDFIKELVDKETPMKPILREFINKYDCEDYEYLCGKCKDHLAYHRGRVDRCNDNECNQLVDWSDEE